MTWAEKYGPKVADPDMRPIYLTWDQMERARLEYNLWNRWNRLTRSKFCDLLDVRLVGE